MFASDTSEKVIEHKIIRFRNYSAFLALHEEQNTARKLEHSYETYLASIHSRTMSRAGSVDRDNHSLCAKLLLCNTEAINDIVLLGAFLAFLFTSDSQNYP